MKRILLKLSGEALKNNSDGIIDFNYCLNICKKIKKLYDSGFSIGIVVGGGNIWRGRNNTYIDSSLADKVGILSTTINSLILNATFNELNVDSVILNSLEIESIVDKVEKNKINSYIAENKIIIFGGGTGEVGCSTDTAAALRAIDIAADYVVKLTNVDGVYDKDPTVYSDAVKYDEITFNEVLQKDLKVMDKEAFIICKENNIPIIVMNVNDLEKLEYSLKGKNIGSFIK